MKRIVVLFLMVFLFFTSVIFTKALSKEKLMELIKAKVSVDLIVGMIKQECVDFELDPDTLIEFTKNKVNNSILRAIQDCKGIGVEKKIEKKKQTKEMYLVTPEQGKILIESAIKTYPNQYLAGWRPKSPVNLLGTVYVSNIGLLIKRTSSDSISIPQGGFRRNKIVRQTGPDLVLIKWKDIEQIQNAYKGRIMKKKSGLNIFTYDKKIVYVLYFMGSNSNAISKRKIKKYHKKFKNLKLPEEFSSID